MGHPPMQGLVKGQGLLGTGEGVQVLESCRRKTPCSSFGSCFGMDGMGLVIITTLKDSGSSSDFLSNTIICLYKFGKDS